MAGIESNLVTAHIATKAFTTKLIANGHTLIADEPLNLGGKNLGPTPGDYLRMALASCTAITLRMYANRKNWDLKEIQVDVNTSQADGETLFARSIELIGTLDEEQRTRLLQVANACPVHKALSGTIQISTALR
ncbi:MAG: OsmC family protein [Cyclobacteriaceae bacterium]|jgi:putative redox protein|nr:OsmC family protein [Cyclobacteriaceae bacterium]